MTDIITIIDYGMGNIGSISNMIKKAGGTSKTTSDISVIEKATKLLLPGVGAFDAGIENLEKTDLIDILNKKVLIGKTPILGICLGMQLMTNKSAEGSLKGLSWVDAETIKFESTDNQFRIPHMGWNQVSKLKNHDILVNIDINNARYYFVHSYYVKCHNKDDVLLKCNYISDFDAAFQKDNIFGFQFHPEKSHKYGMQIIKNFISL
jgi:imidazole glycerol-phosphate synthase subunit HisH